MNLFAVLKHFDPMFGRDLHIALPPGSPVPTPPAPHLTTDTLMGKGITVLWDKTVFTHFGWSVQRGSDIGPFIAHIPLAPNTLIPLIMLASASKSEWGSQQYLVKNKPAACALLFVVNPNLNCCDPVPMPLDAVLAITTHFVGMTWGEIVAGALMMALDVLITGAINYLGGALFDKMGQAIYERALYKPMSFLFARVPFNKVTDWFFQHGVEEIVAKGFAAPLAKLVGMDFLGSPVGFSFPPNAFSFLDDTGKDPSIADSPGFMELAYNAQRDAIDNPSVPTHDVPPNGAEGAGGMTGTEDAGAGGANGAGGGDDGPTMSTSSVSPVAADQGPNMSMDPGGSDAEAGPNMSPNPGASPAADAGTNMSPNPGISPAADERPNMSVDPGSSGRDEDPDGGR